MSMKLTPRMSLVTVVEVKKDENTTTDAGIILPSATSREYRLCEIVAVGPGTAYQAGEVSEMADLRPGQQVLVKVASSRRIDDMRAVIQPIGIDFKAADGRDLKLVYQDQIVAIVDDTDAGSLFPR